MMPAAAALPAPVAEAGPADLTREQVATLLAPLHGNRVQHKQGQAHLEAWDVRRWLTRAFGFGGWTDQTLELACIGQTEINPGRWTVVYRAQVRLIVRATDGRVLGSWDDAAMGEGINQKGLGTAHDLAMKSALSQALKRCAVNAGDGFGLSLYNGGRPGATVVWSAAHLPPKQADDEKPAEAAVDPVKLAANDAPVEPEPSAEDEPERHRADGERATGHPAEGEQVRRSNRAEPGPWEQAPPKQEKPQQQAEQLSPQARAMLTAAHESKTPEAFAKVRADAVQAGAPEDFLARLDQIAAQKRAAAQHKQQGAGTDTAATPADVTRHAQQAEPEQGAEHAVALGEMYDAAQAAQLADKGEADDAFAARFSVQPYEGTVEQLRTMRDDLLDAAQGAAA